jgi:CysZ protein
MALPFRAAKFLFAHPSLWKFVVIPALINVLLFGLMLYLLIPRVGTIAEWLLFELPFELGAEWLETGFRYLLASVLGVLSVVAAYVFVLLFGGIAASPFNDLLSERAERILLRRDEAENRDEMMIWGIFRGIGASLFLLVSYLLLMAWVLLLNIIPGLGPPIAAILGTILSALFLTVEYSDAPIDRRGGGLRRKFEAVEGHRTLSVGFGLGASLLLWIPFLNFLTIPIAAAGGTALGIVLAEWEQSAARRPDVQTDHS